MANRGAPRHGKRDRAFRHDRARGLSDDIGRSAADIISSSLRVVETAVGGLADTATRVARSGRAAGGSAAGDPRIPLAQPLEMLQEALVGAGQTFSQAFADSVGMADSVADFGRPSAAADAVLASVVEVDRVVFPPPPYLLDEVRLHAFFVKGDLAKIQERLDQMFLEPSGGAVRYVALMPRLALFYADVGQLRAEQRPYSEWGFIREREVNLWAFTIRVAAGTVADLLPSARLVWVPLYTFVDAPPAIAAGREVYGFPKESARFDATPEWPASGRPIGPSLLAMDAYGFPVHATAREADWHRLLDVRPATSGHVETYPQRWSSDGGAPADTDLARTVFIDLAGMLFVQERSNELFNPFGEVAAFLDVLAIGRVPMAFLKQSIDPADGGRADFQAIVEADMEVRRIRAGGFTDSRFVAELRSLASHPFLRGLGVEGVPQDVGSALWFDFDLALGPGRELWHALAPDSAAGR